MICVKQLTLVSLHFVNIWQVMQGFQSISLKTSFLKGIYVVMQGETICPYYEAGDPESYSLAFSLLQGQ